MSNPADPKWSELDVMTDEQRRAAAHADTDNPPLSPEDYKRMADMPRVRQIRRQLRLSPQEFADRYCIDPDALKSWEQGLSVPGATISAYLEVIVREPDLVRRALEAA